MSARAHALRSCSTRAPSDAFSPASGRKTKLSREADGGKLEVGTTDGISNWTINSSSNSHLTDLFLFAGLRPLPCPWCLILSALEPRGPNPIQILNCISRYGEFADVHESKMARLDMILANLTDVGILINSMRFSSNVPPSSSNLTGYHTRFRIFENCVNSIVAPLNFGKPCSIAISDAPEPDP